MSDNETRFQPGQRVTATLYGEKRTGTVTRHANSLVWVLWDGKAKETWQHPESLTVVESPGPDYIVTGGGTVYIITPQNDAARENLEAGVGSEAQRWAGGIAVEHRYIGPLVEQLSAEGWTVGGDL